MEFRVEGMKEVEDRLTKAGPTLALKAFARAAQASMEVITTELEIKTPVRAFDQFKKDRMPGTLRSRIKTDVKVDTKGCDAAVGFGKEGYIAYWVEYGHRMKGHGQTRSKRKQLSVGEGKNTHVPAHPFMRPAADASAQTAIDVFADVLLESLSVIEG